MLLAHLPPSSAPRSSFYSFLRMRPAGSCGQAQTPPRGGGRGAGRPRPGPRWGSRRLRQPWRPARALPRPGPHAPISEEPLGGVGGRSAKAREDALRSATGAGQEGRGGGPLFMPVWRRLSYFGARAPAASPWLTLTLVRAWPVLSGWARGFWPVLWAWAPGPCSQPGLGSICSSGRRLIPAPLAPAAPGPLAPTKSLQPPHTQRAAFSGPEI